MTALLLTSYKRKIRELRLTPAGGGCFELSLDGELVYSKLKTGVFPDEKAMLDLVGKKLAG